MKTPNEVIASDNSAAVNEMKESVVEVCDIMFKVFEKAVEESCGKFDRSIYAYDRLPYENRISYDEDFRSMCKTHFRNIIGEWDKFIDLKFLEEETGRGFPFYTWCFEIRAKFDTMKNCFVEVAQNIPPKRQD